MKSKPQIWYSYSGKKPDKNQAAFYHTKDFDWVDDIECDFERIKDELLNYIELERKRIKPYFNKDLVTKNSIWRTSAFLFWKKKFKKNQRFCPETMAILDQVPNLVSAFVSILEPGSEIKPHRGDTNGIMRGHLPLVVPQEKSKIGFRVGEHTTVWQEGQLILFNDAEYHSAWNYASTDRVVLIVDVVRPEFAGNTYQICSVVLGSLIYQNLISKIGIVSKAPQTIKDAIIKTFALLTNLMLRCQSR